MHHIGQQVHPDTKVGFGDLAPVDGQLSVRGGVDGAAQVFYGAGDVFRSRRFLVPLNSMCSRKWEMPAWGSVS